MEGPILTATGHKMVALRGRKGVQAVDTTAMGLDGQAGSAQLWKKRVAIRVLLSPCVGGGKGGHGTHDREAQGVLGTPG